MLLLQLFMIEVEKKFLFTPEQESQLLEGAVFFGEKILIDVYYDADAFALTSKDWWLRTRDGRFELKIALPHAGGFAGDIYDEVEDELRIREILKLTRDGDLRAALEAAGYHVFARCQTTRRKYEKDGFHIDCDVATFPDVSDFTHRIAEIELMVYDDSMIGAAGARIAKFAELYGLSFGSHHGKIVEYLFRFRPEHYAALVRAGVVREL